LVLDSGGSLFRGGDSIFSENPKLGALIVAAMDVMGYDAMALGVYDLQAPLTTVQARFGEAGFPILSANVTPGRTLPNVQPYVLHKVGGHTVAIVGVTPALADRRLTTMGLAPMAPDPIAVVKRAVRRASRRADVVLLLSTLQRSSAETLAEAVPGIDAIIGVERGMQFQAIAVPGAAGEVVLHAAGIEGQYLGVLTLHLDAEGQVTDFDGRARPLYSDYERHPEIVELIREHAANP
jgi:2',3'-cyclic-nucleotide 2'-phosphodiesterase (5'-nucleotidase family)